MNTLFQCDLQLAEELLTRLVGLPSVNPHCLPRDADPAIGGEMRVAQFLQTWAEQNGFDCEFLLTEEKRPCVILTYNAGPDAPVIAGFAHMDTVWTAGIVDPFRLRKQEDGCFHGLGASDDKGAIVTGLLALLQLKRNGTSKTTFRMVCTCDEEVFFTGIDFLIPNRLKPDAAIVMESTDLDVVSAHKGNVRWKFTARGVAAHASMLPCGENAVYKAARMISVLERLANELNERDTHELLGHPTLNVGLVRGGLLANSVPDFCEFLVDRRLLPEETPESALREISERLEPLSPKYAVESVFFSEPFEIKAEHPFLRHCVKTVRRMNPAMQVKGLHCATEAARTGKAGIPTIVFGAGSIAVAHSAMERIDLNDLLRASEILTELIEQYHVSPDQC